MNKIYLWITSAIVCLSLGYFLGYKTGRTPQTITNSNTTHKVEQDTRTVEKGVTVLVRPDGTKETRIEARETIKEKVVNSNIEVDQEIRPPRVWGVGLYTSLAPNTEGRALVLTLDRKLFENVSVGLYGRYKTDGELEAGAGLRIDF